MPKYLIAVFLACLALPHPAAEAARSTPRRKPAPEPIGYCITDRSNCDGGFLDRYARGPMSLSDCRRIGGMSFRTYGRCQRLR